MNIRQMSYFEATSRHGTSTIIKLTRIIGLIVLFAALERSSTAQSVTVTSVDASPLTVVSGDIVTITVVASASDNFLGLNTSSLSGTCTAPNYLPVPLGFSIGGSAATGYTLTGTGNLTANSNLGPVLVSCTISASFFSDSNTYSDGGSDTFTVVACEGSAEATVDPGYPSLADGYEDVNWTLTATMNPAEGAPNPGHASGAGIGNQLPSEFIYDCDGGTNDSQPEVDAEIDQLDPSNYGGYIIFNFQVQNYRYFWDYCDSCSYDPNGVENISTAPMEPVPASVTGYCGIP